MPAVDGGTRAGFSELIYEMVGIVRITESERAFSQMLSEVPSDYLLPETCASTFMPLLDDAFDQCDEMRNEYENGTYVGEWETTLAPTKIMHVELTPRV